MNKHVIIVPDVYNDSTWSHADVPDVLEYIKQEFVFVPETLCIFHEKITGQGGSTDVTPVDPASEQHFRELTGTFYVVVYPGFMLDQIGGIQWEAIKFSYNFVKKLLLPADPVAPGSPNNELSARQNSARVNGRIPYIVGELRSTPDLIALPYSFYNSDGKEEEHCLMCIGTGYYQILDCRDGDTPVTDIADAAVSVYDPETDITSAAIYQVGEAFTDAPLYTIKSSSINGQTLDTPAERKLESTNLYFEYPNLIKSRVPVDFTGLLAVNDSVSIYGAEFGVSDAGLSGAATVDTGSLISFETTLDLSSPNDYKGLLLTAATFVISGSGVNLSGQYEVASIVKTTVLGGFKYSITLSNPAFVNPNWSAVTGPVTATIGATLNNNDGAIDLDEVYTVQSVSSSAITLVNPVAINSDWDKVNELPGHSTVALTADISLDKMDSRWVGWHSIIMPEATGIMANFSYPQGLYWTSKKGRVDPHRSEIVIEYQMLDTDGDPIGGIFTKNDFRYQLIKDGFGVTLKIDLPYPGSFRFRARRSFFGGEDQANSTVKIKDVFATAVSSKRNYGNVTIVRSKTIATDGALSVKERKLNFKVVRKFPLNVTGPLTATRSAADALVQMAIDPHIGRRTLAEVDYAQIYDTVDQINSYFGSSQASQFCYTFDDVNQSFQEAAGMIASAIFCEPYRRYNKLLLQFERETDNSVLLFNHRNKVPETETRELIFGIQKNYDGVIVEYTDPADDSRVKFFLPDENIKNPQTINTVGVRNKRQAYLIAYRAWNKMQFQRETVHFEAMREADLLVRTDRVLCADNTLTTTQDGQIESFSGLIVITSQPVKFVAGLNYVMHLQLDDGSVDAIGCSAGIDEYHVQLSRAALRPLFAGTAYMVTSDDDETAKAFIVMEKEPSASNTSSLTLINYDSRYYQNDHDFNNYGWGFNWGNSWGGVI